MNVEYVATLMIKIEINLKPNEKPVMNSCNT